MKLVRFGAPGAEKPGLVDAQGAVRDLSAHVRDITGDTLDAATLDKLRKLDTKALPAAPQGVRLGPPVGGVKNFLAIGLNYADHAKEANMPIPAEPIIFAKMPNCMVGPNDDVMIPTSSPASARATLRRRTRSPTSPATRSATTSPSAISSSSAAGSG
jgi:2-keto-4-pentenoate hydratase/2-oxohepta-3-ene-1,7-dioic acid hydratase in catechol pathway